MGNIHTAKTIPYDMNKSVKCLDELEYNTNNTNNINNINNIKFSQNRLYYCSCCKNTTYYVCSNQREYDETQHNCPQCYDKDYYIILKY